jgi:hypothetical protein
MNGVPPAFPPGHARNAKRGIISPRDAHLPSADRAHPAITAPHQTMRETLFRVNI